MSQKVLMYTTAVCPYCIRAKQLLESKHISFEEIAVDNNPELRALMETKSGRRTVPQIFIGDRHVGGFDDLKALSDSGQLSEWLK